MHPLARPASCSALAAPLAAAETSASLAQRFAREVGRRLSPPVAEMQRYAALARQMLGTAGIALERPQYLLLVDRSPRVQAALLFWLAPQAEPLLMSALRPSPPGAWASSTTSRLRLPGRGYLQRARQPQRRSPDAARFAAT